MARPHNCKRCRKPKTQCTCGRPIFDGKDPKEVLAKLEQAALIDATVEEMCFYADISVSAYYRYLDRNPKFRDKIQSLRERLTLKSRQNIAARIEAGDVTLSKWTLERKKPKEFGETIRLDNIDPSATSHPEDLKAVEEFHKKLKDNLLKRSREKAKQEGELQ